MRKDETMFWLNTFDGRFCKLNRTATKIKKILLNIYLIKITMEYQ